MSGNSSLGYQLVLREEKCMAEEKKSEESEVSSAESKEQVSNAGEIEDAQAEEMPDTPKTPQPPQDDAEANQAEPSGKTQGDTEKESKKLSKRTIIIIAAIVVVAIVVAIVAGVSCSGPSYKLDKDESVRTEWGTAVQFKVDKGWEEKVISDSESSACTSYSGGEEKAKLFIFIDIDNTRGRTYKYSSSATYGDWLDNQEEFIEELSSEYLTYSGYSMDQLGDIDVDGNEFRLYKQQYTMTYRDDKYAEVKEKNPEAQKSYETTMFYAVLKDGRHDMVVDANNEKLLKDVLGTMTISW